MKINVDEVHRLSSAVGCEIGYTAFVRWLKLPEPGS